MSEELKKPEENVSEELKKPEENVSEVQESKTDKEKKPSFDDIKMEMAGDEADDSKRLEGDKEAANNRLELALEQQKEKPEESSAMPLFFVDAESRHRVEVDIMFSKRDGRILSVSKTNVMVDFSEFDKLGHTKEWFEFTQPSYEELIEYRRRSAVFNAQMGQAIVDKTKLRDHYLVLHLKNWSLKDKDGNPVLLSHNLNGSLDENSMAKVYNLSPVILDIVLTIFENDCLIS